MFLFGVGLFILISLPSARKKAFQIPVFVYLRISFAGVCKKQVNGKRTELQANKGLNDSTITLILLEAIKDQVLFCLFPERTSTNSPRLLNVEFKKGL